MVKRAPLCHPDRPYVAKDMCRACYMSGKYEVNRARLLQESKERYYANREKVLDRMAERRILKERGLDTRIRKQRAATCHPDKSLVAQGLCQACYMARYRSTPTRVALKDDRRDAGETAARGRTRGRNYIQFPEGVDPKTRSADCEACGVFVTGKACHADHLHLMPDGSGPFRGWLCPACNLTAGHLESARAPLVLDYLARKAVG